jgi:hypothetical protein
MEKAVPNPDNERYLSYTQLYYSKNKDKWEIYNKREKIFCDVCNKSFLFIKPHLQTETHKKNKLLSQKTDLIKSILEAEL